ncbi:hypothetical protein GKZ68_15905 [Hymenobacter sp. BRD128]|uniref:hypothetical protein n=1 Tax=Hymenobacter sp. BRD128 TaxID=2675878 RepID=UPI0015666848|nr:hypothetical protein [Hymenobacter sp. BRD128]QKG57973.1 hypothetical protein GKZ68_15905 [Hymenobacter sp. BRD128]
MQRYFQEFQRIAEAGTYHELAARPVPKPEYFNWTTEILEGLHVATHPDKPALVLAGDAGRRTITYAELAGQANQLGIGNGAPPRCCPSRPCYSWCRCAPSCGPPT